VSLAQDRVGPHRLKVLGHLLSAKILEAVNLRVPSVVNALIKELIEIEVVLDQERNCCRL